MPLHSGNNGETGEMTRGLQSWPVTEVLSVLKGPDPPSCLSTPPPPPGIEVTSQESRSAEKCSRRFEGTQGSLCHLLSLTRISQC